MEKITINKVSIKTQNDVHRKAIIEVCEMRGYYYVKNSNEILVYKAFKEPELTNFLQAVEFRLNDILANQVDISLSAEQKEVLEKALDMLANANIGLCHDYKSTGQLMAFNSNGGRVYACEEDKDDNELSDAYVKGVPTAIDSNHKGKHLYSFYAGGFSQD